ncbi:hypothetical protein V5F77_10530 [Xanthobacter sp. DSM 24535]|uniref:hypothetical protein n=1 Tax=Roseixanthobacter psychrophilus TaxID=3119917 RepID=UPI00372A350A
MTLRSIYWPGEDGRLKSFSAATQAKGGALVKIEIEVFDPLRLGMLLQDLAEIQRDQKGADKPKKAERGAGAIAAPPRLLTYRGER